MKFYFSYTQKNLYTASRFPKKYLLVNDKKIEYTSCGKNKEACCNFEDAVLIAEILKNQKYEYYIDNVKNVDIAEY